MICHGSWDFVSSETKQLNLGTVYPHLVEFQLIQLVDNLDVYTKINVSVNLAGT